jgi:hypothetical protein
MWKTVNCLSITLSIRAISAATTHLTDAFQIDPDPSYSGGATGAVCNGRCIIQREIIVHTPESPSGFTFQQIHIDAARNSSDDFNLFHDKNKWQRIHGNPFGGPIVLGFQLECLIEYQTRLRRLQHDEDAVIARHNLRFSNYQITFADVVHPGEHLFMDIKKSQLAGDDNPVLANRILLKKEKGPVLMGYKKESQRPLFAADTELSRLPALRQLPDRCHIGGSGYFLKRKFMNTGNAKNFLSGSLAEQDDYFDELEDKADFPEIFPVSLVSCALLERARNAGHDFEHEPMVYTSHKISVDREHLRNVKSNDVLHLLIKPEGATSADRGLGRTASTDRMYQCIGIIGDAIPLFQAEIAMAPLKEIVKAIHKKQNGLHLR